MAPAMKSFPRLLPGTCLLILVCSLAGCALFAPRNVTELKIKDLKGGEGVAVERGMDVTVEYTGKFRNGDIFVSSYDGGQPRRFLVGGSQVLAGWDLGVVGMREGGKRRLTIPHWLAYGRSGVNCDAEGENCAVPPLTPVVFDLELIEIHEESMYK